MRNVEDWVADDAVCCELLSPDCQPVDTLTAVDKAVVVRAIRLTVPKSRTMVDYDPIP